MEIKQREIKQDSRFERVKKTQIDPQIATLSNVYSYNQNNTNKTIKHQLHNTYVRTSSTCHYFLKSHITQSTIATQNTILIILMCTHVRLHFLLNVRNQTAMRSFEIQVQKGRKEFHSVSIRQLCVR